MKLEVFMQDNIVIDSKHVCRECFYYGKRLKATITYNKDITPYAYVVKLYTHNNEIVGTKIFFDNRTGFIKMIPENFQKSTLFWLIVMTLYFALKYTIKALIRYKKTSFRDLYDNTLLFVLPTLNNQRALQKVIDVVKPVKNNVRIATKDPLFVERLSKTHKGRKKSSVVLYSLFYFFSRIDQFLF